VAKFKIEGVEPYDGEYELDLQHLTNRDFYTIRQLADLTAPEVFVAFARGDLGLGIALAIIAVERKLGHTVDREKFWDGEVGTVSVVPVKEAKPDPPASAPPSVSDDSSGENEKPGTSGSGSSEPSVDQPEKSPSGTGTQD
jgi:hypothetical protein